MKAIIIFLLFFVLISCDKLDKLKLTFRERHKMHMKSMREKIKSCVYNNTNASDNLKSAFKEDTETPLRPFFSTLKDKLSKSDKEILKECRKESVKLLREERINLFKEIKTKSEHKHFENNITTLNSSITSKKSTNLRNLSFKIDEIYLLFLYSCIKSDIRFSQNMGKLLKNNNIKDILNLKYKGGENLTEEERDILISCIFQLE